MRSRLTSRALKASSPHRGRSNPTSGHSDNGEKAPGGGIDASRTLENDHLVSRMGGQMKFDPQEVARGLRMSWSLATARQWTAENPAAGQCNVTAILVHELFGGELLKTCLPEGDHFYNRIAGQRYDFTDSQFSQPIFYSDILTTRSEAERGATSSEVAALRAAFARHCSSSG